MHDTVRITWDGDEEDVVLPVWIETALVDGDIQLSSRFGTSTLQCNYIYANDFLELAPDAIVFSDGEPVPWRLTRLDSCMDIEVDSKPGYRFATAFASAIVDATHGRVSASARHYPPDGWMVTIGQRGSPRALKFYLSSAKAGDGRELLWELTGGRAVLRIEGEIASRGDPSQFAGKPLAMLKTCMELLHGLRVPLVHDLVAELLRNHEPRTLRYEAEGPSRERLIHDLSRLRGRALAMGVLLEELETRTVLVMRAKRRTEARIRRAQSKYGRKKRD